MTGVFVTGVGTGVGKTFVARALAAAARARGLRVVALKPLETGVAPTAADARALAGAADRPELADAPGLYRARAALAPWAATLEGEPAPDLASVVASARALEGDADLSVIEGAGGLCVPIDAENDIAHLAVALGHPVLLVAPDALGVLSSVITAGHAARALSVELAAVVLVAQRAPDPSARTNARILRARIEAPIIVFPHCDDDDAALARAAEASGLLDAVL